MPDVPSTPFWSLTPEAALTAAGTPPTGLTAAEVLRRRALAGPPRARRVRSPLKILASQFLNPLVLMLIVAAAISFPVGSFDDGIVILGIVFLSGGLGFYQEYVAENAVAKLLAMVHTTVTVRRDGTTAVVPVDDVVAGDLVELSAGATVPADARLIASNGLQVDESTLTGESFPATKAVEAVGADVAPAGRSSAVFLGTHVVSGTATVVAMGVGAGTEVGRISDSLENKRPPTAFDIGLQRFGSLLVRVSTVLVLCIFAVNMYLHRPMLESFMFSLALAVGLVPELLPAIVTVNLARGARRMAEAEVVVKRLPAIEDFGAIDVLCSDKTGTLTEGEVRLEGALGVDGSQSRRALELAWLNASFEAGYANPIDAALRAAFTPGAGDTPISAWTLVGELPYDFARKRLSVVVDRDGRRWLITKGQIEPLLGVCTTAEPAGRPGETVALASVRGGVDATHQRLAEEGKRVLGVAIREVPAGSPVSTDLERDLTLVGLLVFTDPPKADARTVIADLRHLGIALKVVTGDDHRVARHVWRELLGSDPVLLTGADIRAMETPALARRVRQVDVFAEVDPGQKERIVHALRVAGRVVAYLGDGINDAPALRAADVGISVDTAADVAKEAADIVLRRRDLAVVANGVREGRRTMANTLKYVYYVTSANFGNMLSMAISSLFLPFLPLLPKQILLNNFLADLPAMAIAADHVDADQLVRPGRWRTDEIRSFMFVFGSISSIFDLTTFAVLVVVAGATPDVFRTAWFTESLMTELVVLYVLRSRLPIGKSRPATALVVTTLTVGVAALALPWTGLGGMFAFTPLPLSLLAAIVGITAAYAVTTEFAKRRFFRVRSHHRKA